MITAAATNTAAASTPPPAVAPATGMDLLIRWGSLGAG
jgi:hypothetical protein